MEIMKSQITREWIMNEFNEKRKKNPALSLRAFARFLQVPASRLSEILNGKRPLTIPMARKIADRLGFTPDVTRKFLNSVGTEYRRDRVKPRKGLANGLGATVDPAYEQLSLDTFHAISDWHHFAILSLMETKDFKSNEAWIARRLGLSVVEVNMALDRLARLGLIERKGTRLINKYGNVATKTDISSAALRKWNSQLMEKGMNSLEDVPMHLRDITATIMAIDPNKLIEAKKIIKKFRRKLCEYLEESNCSEVYAVCVQLVPLSIKLPEELKK